MEQEPQKQDNHELIASKSLQILRTQYSQNPAKTISQILDSKPPSLRMIQRMSGDALLKSILVKILADFVGFLNIGKNMDGRQITQTIELIIETYPSLTLLDFKLFFSRMKTGFYGQFYDRMDGSVILEKLSAYVSEKQDEIESRNILEHRRIKMEDALGPGYHPDVIKAMEDAIGKKKIEKAFANAPKRELTAAEKIHNRWLKQFDNLFARYGLPHKSGRFIKIGDTLMDYEKFMNRKFENATNQH